MSDDLDLTEAVEAAATEVLKDLFGYRPYRVVAERIVRAAAPLIAAQVRAQIAGEIEAAVARNIGGHPYSDRDRGKLDAARIARGDAK